jgi:hypothetical protein
MLLYFRKFEKLFSRQRHLRECESMCTAGCINVSVNLFSFHSQVDSIHACSLQDTFENEWRDWQQRVEDEKIAIIWLYLKMKEGKFGSKACSKLIVSFKAARCSCWFV